MHTLQALRGQAPDQSCKYILYEIMSGSHVKYTYMIGQEHSHMVLPNYISFSQLKKVDYVKTNGGYYHFLSKTII